MPKGHKAILGSQLNTPMQTSAVGDGTTTTTRKQRKVRNVRARTGHSVSGGNKWSAGNNVSPQIQQGLANMINGLTTLNVDLAKITPDQLYQYGLTCFANV